MRAGSAPTPAGAREAACPAGADALCGVESPLRRPRGTLLEATTDVKKLWIALALAAGCSREPVGETATIAPAEARPAPTATDTIDRRSVTTSGSPVPASAVAPGTETITISDAGFSVRPLLPRAHTAFRIANNTDTPHHVTLRGATGSAAAAVPARGEAILQLLLSDAQYELVCTTPGHSERAQFKTYRAGVPQRSPAAAAPSR